MFFTLLALLQMHSTWASTLTAFDESVNSEIRKLEESIDPSCQQLQIKDVKIEMAGCYYAFILYEITEKKR